MSNINYSRSKSINAKVRNLSSVSYTMEANLHEPADADIDTFNVSNVDGGSDGAVSEAGTYTVHKDYTDEEKARMDIDKVFSVGVLTEDESNEACIHNFKVNKLYIKVSLLGCDNLFLLTFKILSSER